jgi:hypothetical protein
MYNKLFGKDMEGSSYGWIWGIILAFSWRQWENHEKPVRTLSDSQDSNQAPPEYKSEVLLLELTYLGCAAKLNSTKCPIWKAMLFEVGKKILFLTLCGPVVALSTSGFKAWRTSRRFIDFSETLCFKALYIVSAHYRSQMSCLAASKHDLTVLVSDSLRICLCS